MRSRIVLRLFAGLGAGPILFGLVGRGAETHAVSAGEDAASPAFYTERVQPILEKNCFSCHGGLNHRGGLSLQTRAGMLKGGHDGPVLVPGDPEKSMLVRLMRHEGPADDPMPMPPPPRPKVSDADIATVTEWIKAGALMPEDAPKP